MQKGFAQPLLIIIVLILALGVGFYFFISQQKLSSPIPSPRPSSSPDLNFKTYKNNSLGFEFNYPKDLEVKEETEEEYEKRSKGTFRKNFTGYVGFPPGEFLGSVVVLNKDQSYEASPLHLWVFNNPDNLTIDAWYNKYWYYPFVWGDFTSAGKNKTAPTKDILVDGVLGKSGVVDYQPGKPNFIYLLKDNKVFLFKVLGQGEDILESFKFLQ